MSPGCCSSPSKEPAPTTPAMTEPVASDACCGSGDKNENSKCCTDEEERCDEKCVDIAASMAADHGSPNVGRAVTFSAARDKYRELLATARCICRSVLEDAAVSCCAIKNTTAQQHAVQPAEPKRSTEDSDSVGSSSAIVASGKALPIDSCCEPEGTAAHASSGCSRRKNKAQPAFTSATKPQKQDSCCSAGPSVPSPDLSVLANGQLPSPSRTDDAVLSMSVEGMTCSDCASKLENSLKTFEGTSDVRVNFIRGRADLRYDPTVANPEDIIGKARAATGFGITEIRKGAKGSLDLLVDSRNAKALASLRVDGVLDVVPLTNSTARVNFDPDVIGSRDLVQRIGPLSAGLAPDVPDSTGDGHGQFRLLSIYTVLATMLTLPVLILAWAEGLVSKRTQAIVSLPLATAVQLLAVPIFYKPALRSLVLHHALELDMLVVVSITAAFTYSLVAFGFRMQGQPLETGEFFETSTLLITLVMMGRLFASYARIRAVAAVSLRSHHSATAMLVQEGSDDHVEIDARLLQYGDILKVLPHSRVPTDGVVVKGLSEVDESMLTGESLPVPKEAWSDVIAGTMNHSGVLFVKLTRLPGDNTVMDIARLVEDATNSKPRIQDLADRVAAYFLPIVGICALLCFVIWIAIGLKVRNYSTGQAISNAITYGIAVLAVSCPCALGLAVPMVLVVAGGIAAKGGVIIKSAESTERARKVTDVVFDKTGTITEPGLEVLAQDYLTDDKSGTLAVIRQLVSGSSHPISIAVLKHIEETCGNEVKTICLENTKSIPGAGVEAKHASVTVRAGSPNWTGHSDHESVRSFSSQGLSILTATSDDQLLAVFGLKNRVRSTAGHVISQLKDSGITVHLVSGDHPQAVEAVAKEVGINLSRAVGGYKPEQKRDYVASLMNEGKYVLFCGDGTNDAVAVAQANIGVQISEAGSASAVTQSAADVILLSGLNGLPLLLDVSRAAFRRIVFNFAWSATYNVLAILLAGGAFFKVRIEPAYAGAGEMLSIMPVIVAALTMLLVKLKP